MPQMMPIYWMTIFMLNIILFIMIIIMLNFSNMTNYMNINFIKINKKFNKNFLMKWK
uniref:ATP synthase F0 subunit 8 n=1 Tax=Geniotrigona thoracica TaxID=395500 RepID=UPI003D5209B2